ncbi:uncharacterized protein BBA_08966 [Beauveria bassiana ARSEF 2860]|uniref:F-box domain-containing protein n=1 Tax=Beauveria bassiana (strain ARSEF 2860) TaxID=655819 RepID=J4UGL5_BEAB2|nr:uncharacterized protein BBA_08966 [Beauveria bassiana ARSEF 2860]EJP62042.1 hypothetical protein BBA_08966 [Beauveria bassiana ARSEF 2860]
MLPYDAGLHNVRRIGIFPPQRINLLPSSTEAMTRNPPMDKFLILTASKIRHLGLLLTETVFNDIQNAVLVVDDTRNLVRNMPGVEMLDKNVYIALQSLEAMVLQRAGSLLFENALEELGRHIREERLAEEAHDKCSQNIPPDVIEVQRLELPPFTNVLQGCYEIEPAKCTLMGEQNDAQRIDSDTSDRKQINKADLYSSSHPYGRVVARQMSERQQFGKWKLHIASLHSESGAGSDHTIGPPVLAQTTPINATGSFRILGDDVQRIIFSHLDYQSLIFLSQTSHHFHQMARPELADQQDQLQFVMRAEKEFKQHFPNEKSPGNFACYFCYRVLQADSFREDQAHEAFLDCDGSFVLDVKPENAAKYVRGRSWRNGVQRI